MLNAMRRRDFLRAAGVVGGAALLAGTGLAGCDDASSGTDDESILDHPARDCPIDTVVVLMMENRSFDHLLGWLPGANGRQQGLSYVDKDGVAHETWPLAPDFQGCL